MILGIFIRKFRGNEPSENSEEQVPRYIPRVIFFGDRAKKTLYCHLPQIGLTSLLSEAAVEFLPPATALVDKPSFFTPKYQTKGKGVVDEEGEDEAAQAIPDDSQPHQLLPSDSSQYKLQELPPNATSRQQQHWRDQSIKTNNDMLHKIWAAISRIRPCRCQKDDVVHRDNSPSSSGSGSSGTHRVRKRSKRPNDAEHLEQETRSRSYHRLFYFLFYSNVLWSYFLLILN
uniref:Uncharacterized protein n=1 Tax=Brassica oleracea var. oleracea TaxID=109376 RepID=A0A0D3BBL2_BRAOL